jgi:transcriptional regulator GlxA family with amidase domain
MKPATASIDVTLIITPGVLLLDFAAMAEPLRIANRLASIDGATIAPFTLHIAAPTAETMSSLPLFLAGTEALPPALTGTVEHPAWVMLSGVSSAPDVPPAQMRAATRLTTQWLKSVVAPALATGAARLWTVCSGALLAAEAGLLDGRQCTTHHELTQTLKAKHPRAHVQENRIYVIDGPIATSAGITAGLDLALAAIAMQCGPVLASRVAREMVVYWRRAGGDPQRSPLLEHRNHLHPAVHRAQDAVLAQPDADWSVAGLADIAFVSVRHLRRLFTDNAGVTPLAYVNSVRVAQARELIAAQRVSVEQAATRVGFSSARQLRDAWKTVASDLPGDLKR